MGLTREWKSCAGCLMFRRRTDTRYAESEECVDRLLKDYAKHGSLIVALDFDNTVYDFHQTGDTFRAVEELLRSAKHQGHTLVLFTARETNVLGNLVRYCSANGYAPQITLTLRQSRQGLSHTTTFC